MRELKAYEIVPFIKVLSKMQLRNALKDIFTNSTTTSNIEVIAEIVFTILENYEKAEKEFHEFLGKLDNKTPEEIAELSSREFIGLIQELFSEKNLPFFKSAAK